MDFARAQLEKHGWSDGTGLGRNESGIKEAVKVKLKFDTAGVGHNAGDQFTHHWWDHMFNKAANNIQVENTDTGVHVQQKEKFTMSNRKVSSKVLAGKDLLYGRFVKAATLQQGTMVGENKAESSSSEESDGEPEQPFGNLSDEQLLKACGGRTAHKAARHGLKLNGKLARIMEQEARHSGLTPDVTPVATPDISSDSGSDSGNREKKKKEKRAKKRDECDEEIMKSTEGSPQKKEKKKKSKKNKSSVAIESNDNETKCCQDEEHKKSKKSKKNKRQTSDHICVASDTNDMPRRESKKSKQQRSKTFGGDAVPSECNELADTDNKPSGKRKPSPDSEDGEVASDSHRNPSSKKSKKRKKKEKAEK